MIPEFPENREYNSEFLEFFGPVLCLPFVEYVKNIIIKLQNCRAFSPLRRKANSGGEWKASQPCGVAKGGTDAGAN
jgi:hypothetical protein